jgi:nucleoside-diphosphate-sugar epimerase
MQIVAVTAVGGGVGQSVLRALANSDLRSRTIGMDARAMSAGLYWVDAPYLVPFARDDRAYIERLAEICESEMVDVLIPGSDPEVTVLARNQAHFKSLGTELILGSVQAVELCQDKLLASEACMAEGLPFIRTVSLREAQQNAGSMKYPVITKPRAGSGSIGVKLLFSAAELLQLPSKADLVVQPYLAPETASDVSTDHRAVLGRLDQSDELSLQYYIGGSGEILGSFVSVNRLKDGVPIDIVPAADHPSHTAGMRIVQFLASKGLRGPVNLQGRMVNGEPQFFEINPRYTGLTSTRTMMSYREVDAGIWDFCFGDEDKARSCLSFQPGLIGLRFVEPSLISAAKLRAVEERQENAAQPASAEPITVAITGASGYIGSNLVMRLASVEEVKVLQAGVRSEQAGERLIALTRESGKLIPVVGSVPDDVWSFESPDVVVHLAALRPVAEVSKASMYEVNTEGTRSLINALKGTDLTHFIFVSSQSVYGERQPSPWSEDLTPDPETAYAFSKSMAEQLCRSEALDSAITILRPARVYGLGNGIRWDEMPHRFARLARARKPLPIHGTGSEQFDLIHIQDLCDAMLHLILSSPKINRMLVLNLGGGAPAQVRQMGEVCIAAAEELGLSGSSLEFQGEDPDPVRRFGLDIRRARQRLAWSPSVSLSQGFQELIRHAPPA